MSDLGFLGLGRAFRPSSSDGGTEHVVAQHPLRRVLAFRGCSIDDLVNSPIVKNEVIGYFKLQKHIARVCDTRDLERQWNSVE